VGEGLVDKPSMTDSQAVEQTAEDLTLRRPFGNSLAESAVTIEIDGMILRSIQATCQLRPVEVGLAERSVLTERHALRPGKAEGSVQATYQLRSVGEDLAEIGVLTGRHTLRLGKAEGWALSADASNLDQAERHVVPLSEGEGRALKLSVEAEVHTSPVERSTHLTAHQLGLVGKGAERHASPPCQGEGYALKLSVEAEIHTSHFEHAESRIHLTSHQLGLVGKGAAEKGRGSAEKGNGSAEKGKANFQTDSHAVELPGKG
jgi:hypothetical protein